MQPSDKSEQMFFELKGAEWVVSKQLLGTSCYALKMYEISGKLKVESDKIGPNCQTLTNWKAVKQVLALIR